jgi:hypothetical protein
MQTHHSAYAAEVRARVESDKLKSAVVDDTESKTCQDLSEKGNASQFC